MNQFMTDFPIFITRPFRGRVIARISNLLANRRSFFTGAIIFTFSLIFLALLQFSTPDMPDNDGFYHIKLAYLMRAEGLKPDFTWLPLTILNACEFYDHHFFFMLG